MTNDTYSENRHMYVGIEHIWTHLIGFHGNILRWFISKLGITLIQVIWFVLTLISLNTCDK